MKLRNVLSDNLYEFFNRAGEIEPSNRAIGAVADWILKYSTYPEEMWEDPEDGKLIATACLTGHHDDFTKMMQAIRANARRHARYLIADEEDYLIEQYYDQRDQQHEPDDSYEKMVKDVILKTHDEYMANIK